MIKTRTRLVLAMLLFSVMFSPAWADGMEDATPTLYERLGGWDAVHQVVKDTIALHRANPAIGHYFEGVDVPALEGHVTAFFAAGIGGPAEYEGRDMTSTHADMNLSDADFDAVVDDVMKAMEKNGAGEAERGEVAVILESLRPAVMGTAGT